MTRMSSFGRSAKRSFDIAGAAAGLLGLLPILIACAVAVRLSSPGPILFRQQRVGLHGNIFDILKFRTMRPARTGQELQITIGRDPRITAIGAFLRKWKLDELPQLWNVVAGDMSIVGPRPEVPKYVAIYPTAIRDIVLSVRPGITDPCSIYLRHESEILARADDPERFYIETLLPEKLRLASAYARNQTMMTDISIIVRTILAIFVKDTGQAKK